MKQTLLICSIFCSIYLTNGAAVLNETFEGLSDLSGTWTTIFPNCKGSGTASIDSTQAHSGKKSLKISGATGYCNHVFASPTADLSKVGSTWYVRMYIRHTTLLGAQHVAFIAMKDSNDGGKDLRIGGQNKMLQWNRESDDATLPAQSPQGVAQSVPLETGKWICFEYMISSTGTASTWVDGKEVPGLKAGGKVADIDQQWSAKSWRPALTDLRLGWEAYGDGSDTLWYDDVVVSSSKIGC